MISLDFGITWVEGNEGVTYLEPMDIKVYLVTCYSKELNSIEHSLAIAANPKDAMEGMIAQSYANTDYEAVACMALSDMLLKLKKAVET